MCGGQGTRLRPLTLLTNKHLLPIYNKQMVLYPLETLKKLGCTDIILVTGGEHVGQFADLLGDGSNYGVNITYKVQKEAGGIAQALLLARDLVQDTFWVILGDNIFEEVPLEVTTKTQLFGKEVSNPERFGVWDIKNDVIIEKPKNPPTSIAITGLYKYPKEIFEYIETLKPSARGELEITDVNNWCLKNTPTDIHILNGFWSDAGTFESLQACNKWIYEQGR